MHRALHHPNGFADLEITVEDGVLEAIANFANGDARMALNTLEMAVLNGQRNGHQVKLTNADLTQLTSTRSLRYDRAGDEHYDLISALHKSMRNSDVDAAVYWCSRMLAGARSRFTLPAAWFALPPKTLASPTQTPSKWPPTPFRPASSWGCRV